MFAAQDTADNAAQLVVLLEGLTPDASRQLKAALAAADAHHLAEPAFTISDPPSAAANNRLLALFQAAGTAPATHEQCPLESYLNPATACWQGHATVVKYDVEKVHPHLPPRPSTP